MPGNDMAEVVGLYTSLTGTTPLYQRWIYGSHQSRWGYYTQDEVLDIADKFSELDIPCDVIQSCDIRGSSDSSIRNVKPTDIRKILETSDIKQILSLIHI